jgi:serine/threonine protein phosphatase 1
MCESADNPNGLGRIWAIGDIHGCSTALRALMAAIDPRPEDTVVVLGDFIDCGPDSKGVVEHLIALGNRCQLICLLGDHEEMLLNALESKSEFRYWFKLGGKQTLRSYSDWLTDVDVIPPEHVRFIRNCRDYYETETHVFVHANCNPSLPISLTSATKLRWELLDLSQVQAHQSRKTVVVGHTPQVSGEVLDLGFLVCIDTDCFRGGWLTALEVVSREIVRANQAGEAERFLLVAP